MIISVRQCKSLVFGIGFFLAWIHCVSVLGLTGIGQLSFSLAWVGFFAGILKGLQHKKKFSWAFQISQLIWMGVFCGIYLIISFFFQSFSHILIFLPVLFGSAIMQNRNENQIRDLVGIVLTILFLILVFTQVQYTNDVSLTALLLSDWLFLDALIRVFPLAPMKPMNRSSIQNEIKKQGKKLLPSILKSLLIAGPVFVCGLVCSSEETGMLASLMMIAWFYIYLLEKIPLSLRREINHLACFLGFGLGIVLWSQDFQVYETIVHLFWLIPGLWVLNRQVLQKHKFPDHKISLLVFAIESAGSMLLIPFLGLWGPLTMGFVSLILMSAMTMQKVSYPAYKEIAKVLPCLMGAMMIWILSILWSPNMIGQCALVLLYLLLAVGGQILIMRY